MSDASSSDLGELSHAVPLMDQLGLTPQEFQVLGSLFTDATRKMGLEGEKIFAHLAQGAPFSEALGIPPQMCEVLYARAHHWFRIGNVMKAQNLFQTLCMLDGGQADYWVGYGITLRLQEHWKQARVAFETAARLAPKWAVPAFHLLELFMRQGQWDLAAQALSRFEALETKDIPKHLKSEVQRFRLALNQHLLKTP